MSQAGLVFTDLRAGLQCEMRKHKRKLADLLIFIPGQGFVWKLLADLSGRIFIKIEIEPN